MRLCDLPGLFFEFIVNTHYLTLLRIWRHNYGTLTTPPPSPVTRQQQRSWKELTASYVVHTRSH